MNKFHGPQAKIRSLQLIILGCSCSCLVGATPWTVAARPLCPLDSPGKNTGVWCHFSLHGIFPTQGSNLHLLYWQADSLPLCHWKTLNVVSTVGKLAMIVWDDEVFHNVCCCSVAQSCLTLWDPMDCSTPGFPVLHYLQEFAQTHVHWVSDAIQHLILCCPVLLLPTIFPSIRVFSKESVLHIRWLKYWSFSFSTSPPNDYSGLISFRID